jgi:hypothetical protein
MNSAIVKLLVLAAMCLMLAMSFGAPGPGVSAARAAPAGAGEVFPTEARTCVPLGQRCKGITDCCIGRCINGRCLKL